MQDLEVVNAVPDPEEVIRQAFAQAAELIRQFAAAVSRALEVVAQAVRLAVDAITNWCRWIRHYVAIHRLVPTPWHYKRARVALRRRGRPITGNAVPALAFQLRMAARG